MPHLAFIMPSCRPSPARHIHPCKVSVSLLVYVHRLLLLNGFFFPFFFFGIGQVCTRSLKS